MDEYFLSREDLDTIREVGVGDRRSAVVSKEITKATETAMTKKYVFPLLGFWRRSLLPHTDVPYFGYHGRYNAREHPIPFHRAQDLGKVPKKLAGGPAPDLEEAFDVRVPPSVLVWPY